MKKIIYNTIYSVIYNSPGLGTFEYECHEVPRCQKVPRNPWRDFSLFLYGMDGSHLAPWHGATDRLMSRDISTWNSVASRPKTNFYKDIQSASIPPLARFLDELCMNHVDASLEVQLALENVRSNDLFKEFTVWLKENGFLKVDYNTTKFGREIVRVPGIEKKKTMTHNAYRINFDQLRIHLTGLGL